MENGHLCELRDVQRAEAEARSNRARLEWLAKISTKHERELRELQRAEAEMAEAIEYWKRFYDDRIVQEAGWDPAEHPRLGSAPNAGWFVTTAAPNKKRPPSLSDMATKRNSAMADLSGVSTPGMIHASRLAAELHSAARLPGEVAGAAAAGLGTGAKAVVNGAATAALKVASLGLSERQLELIGVTKEDRAGDTTPRWRSARPAGKC